MRKKDSVQLQENSGKVSEKKDMYGFPDNIKGCEFCIFHTGWIGQYRAV